MHIKADQLAVTRHRRITVAIKDALVTTIIAKKIPKIDTQLQISHRESFYMLL